jgi:hypothetical protein
MWQLLLWPFGFITFAIEKKERKERKEFANKNKIE